MRLSKQFKNLIIADVKYCGTHPAFGVEQLRDMIPRIKPAILLISTSKATGIARKKKMPSFTEPSDIGTPSHWIKYSAYH